MYAIQKLAGLYQQDNMYKYFKSIQSSPYAHKFRQRNLSQSPAGYYLQASPRALTVPVTAKQPLHRRVATLDITMVGGRYYQKRFPMEAKSQSTLYSQYIRHSLIFAAALPNVDSNDHGRRSLLSDTLPPQCASARECPRSCESTSSPHREKCVHSCCASGGKLYLGFLSPGQGKLENLKRVYNKLLEVVRKFHCNHDTLTYPCPVHA